MLFWLLYLINNQCFLCFCFPFIRIPAIVFFKLPYRGSGLHCRLSRAGICLIHFNQKHLQRKRKRQTLLANAFFLSWGPQRKPKPWAVCDGESGGTSRFYQLAERFGLRELVAERFSSLPYRFPCHAHHPHLHRTPGAFSR